MKNNLAVSPQTDKIIGPLILRVKNNLAVNPQIKFHFVSNAKYLGFNPQNGKMVLSNQFGLCSSVGKSLGISPQNVKMTNLGINPHVNLAVIPGHRYVAVIY